MYSTRGRPRLVTDAQVQAIMEWHRNHKPIRVLARELGLSTATIYWVIKRGGQFKQPSPEKRERFLRERGRRLKRLREEGWL
jgi:hypothetical protein